MVYHNRGGMEFLPPSNEGSLFGTEPLVLSGAGLYFRKREFEGHMANVTACLEGRKDFADLSLESYQAWCESGWKVPHGSYAAAQRFRGKLLEEVIEVGQALKEFHVTGSNAHLAEELGDVVWPATALSSNGGAVINDTLKTYLFQYAMGTRTDTSDGVKFPVWYDFAAQLAIQKAPITFSDIDRLMSAEFVPHSTPIINQDEDDPISPSSYMNGLIGNAWAAGGINEQQHGYGEDNPMLPTMFTKLAGGLGVCVAEVYLHIAALAHYAETTFAEVCAGNIKKINERIETNTIDKTDGQRLGEHL